jgi:outer membrane murein-binding lipoprotein Lpp
MMFWALIPSWVKLYAAIAVIAALVIAGAYFKGRIDQGAICKEAALQVKIAALERDRTAQRLADAVEEAERITLQKMLETAEAEIAAYEIELATRQEPGCRLSPADVNRLRGGR